VPFPPGGGTDAVARIVAQRLSSLWHQPVIVENRGGAQGNIGTAQTAKASPDGLTLLLAHQGVFTVNPFLYPDIGFDPIKDFQPVSRLTQQAFVLVANPSLPIKSLKDLEQLARTKPGALTFGSSASGPQLAVEMFKVVTNTNLIHVGYKGAGPAVVDVLAGHIDLMVANPASVAQHVKAGKLNAIVLFGTDPIAVLPNVVSANEAGYTELADIVEWYGIAVPVGTPTRVIDQINHDVNLVLNEESVRKKIQELGLNPAPTTTAIFAQQIQRDNQRWGAFIKNANIKAEQ